MKAMKNVDKKLVTTYKELIEKEQNYIKQQCLDFSQIPDTNKRTLKEFITNYKNNNIAVIQINDIVFDNFLILEGLYILQKIREKQQKDKKPLTKKDYAKNRALAHNITDEDKAYTYSIKQTREVLYLCSLICFKDGSTLLDKIILDVSLEKVDLYHPSVNLSNINYIVNNLNIDYICMDISK